MDVKRILVVDDEFGNREMLIDLLKMVFGIDAMVAKNGKEALNEFNQNNFDVVISDLDMPVMNGFKFLKMAKKKRPEVKFIMVSGDTKGTKVEDLFKAGASYFFKKPLNTDELLTVIKKELHS